VNALVGTDHNLFRGKTLRAVAGNSVAVVEMSVLFGIEFYFSVIAEAGRNAAIQLCGLDSGEIPIYDTKRFVGSGEREGKFESASGTGLWW
jgi:hypothetical protein